MAKLRNVILPKTYLGFKKIIHLKKKNDAFIESAVELGTKAIEDCLTNKNYVSTPLPCGEIEAIFYVSTSGLATPSIEARIMNKLAFSDHTKEFLFGD